VPSRSAQRPDEGKPLLAAASLAAAAALQIGIEVHEGAAVLAPPPLWWSIRSEEAATSLLAGLLLGP
jgi:hypothetical protein